MRWDLRDVKVGDELTVVPYWNHEPFSFVTASKVSSVFVVDSTGKKWRRDGKGWGGRQVWDAPRCRPRDTADGERQQSRIFEQQARQLHGVRWNVLPPETIRAVHALVFPKAEPDAVGGGA